MLQHYLSHWCRVLPVRKMDLSVAIFFLTIVLLTSCTDGSLTDDMIQRDDPPGSDDMMDSSACPGGFTYIEKNGIIRVDIEDIDPLPEGWEMATTLAGFDGQGYVIWTGEDQFNTPGKGVMTFKIEITSPGVYQFVWRSRIAAGDSNTEHNDSWLRIASADDFYGEKSETGERVYPRGTGKTPNPEGSSKDGWLKIYMNRKDEWFWRSNTNDKDPFDVFAQFDKAGTYDIEISGRSNAHAIDQFTLFRVDRMLMQANSTDFSDMRCD